MAVKRRLGDWLTAYLELCKDTEPPVSYHNWVGISSIAATLQRRCYIHWGHDTIYPNMYIVLIGPSGKCRKGTAMQIGRSIVKEAGVTTTAETLTRERLIRAMADAVQSYNDPEKKQVVFHCSLYTISEELSVFLGQNDVRFLADLTDWYDSREEWRYETKGSGYDHLQNVCFNLLGATAPDWLTSILPREAIGGGFTSRIIFVVEEKKEKIVENPGWTKEQEQLQKDLIHDLEIIRAFRGPFSLSEEARKLYGSWYVKSEKASQAGKPAISDPRFAGYCERRATHVRKLSMIMCASSNNTMLVSVKDVERSIKVLEAVEKKMPRVFAGLGEARYGKMTQEVLDFINLRGITTRTELMQIYYRDLDNFTLEIIEQVLETMKAVKIVRRLEENEVEYHALKLPDIPTLTRTH